MSIRNDSKSIHEKYHKNTVSQYKVIKKNNFTYRLLIERFEKYLTKDMVVLDIGCGAGTLDFYLAPMVKTIKGVDISKTAIRSCNKTKATLNTKNVSFENIFFPIQKIKGKFDAVIFTEIIEHVENDSEALKEIHKILKPGGILLLSTVSSSAPLHRLKLTKSFDDRVGHLRRYNLSQLKKLISTSGFEVKEVSKTEGIVRNFLFINQVAGRFVRIINRFFSDFVTTIDNITVPIFGESNFIIVAKKK